MAGREKKKPSGSELFTPEIDKQIIEGLLKDQRATLKKLARVGLTEEEVLGRAAELGITKDFLAQCRLGGIHPSVRRCLNCDVEFLSLGPQNRLCNCCRKRQ